MTMSDVITDSLIFQENKSNHFDAFTSPIGFGVHSQVLSFSFCTFLRVREVEEEKDSNSEHLLSSFQSLNHSNIAKELFVNKSTNSCRLSFYRIFYPFGVDSCVFHLSKHDCVTVNTG